MSYEELYGEIYNNFNKKVMTTDKALHDKLVMYMDEWYKREYEAKIKEYLKEENLIAIENNLKEIEKICKLSDYDKLQEIYYSENYNELEKISFEIFDLCKKVIGKQIDFPNINILNDFENKIELFSNNVEEILLKKCKELKSETILDLIFLKNNGNAQVLSIRLNNYLREKN